MLTLVVLLTLSLAAANPADKVDSWASTLAQGPEASHYDRALRRFVRESRARGDQRSLVATIDPSDLAALHGESLSWAAFALGKAAFDDGRAREAGQLLAQVDREDPLRPHALAMLAELAWNGDRSTSIRHYREILDTPTQLEIPGLEALDELKQVAVRRLVEDAPNRERLQQALALAD